MKLIAGVLLLAACVAGGTSSGDATGAVCPTNNPPTYASFGQSFFQTYCLACHSISSTNRHGAPGNDNYDTEADIKAHATAIDLAAAAGPDATNTAMPKVEGTIRAVPSMQERITLGEFLACERQ